MNLTQSMTLEEFREFAKRFNVIPVSKTYLADTHTPLSVYQKLAGNRPSTFLLESAEHGGTWSRYSFIGVRSEATLSEKNGKSLWLGVAPHGAPSDIDPLEALKIATSQLRTPTIEGLPPLTGGFVGYAGYEIVRRLERIPHFAKTDMQIPEIAFMLTTDLAVLDHLKGTLTLISNAINWDGSNERVDEAYFTALSRLEAMESDMKAPLDKDLYLVEPHENFPVMSNMSSDEYRNKVELIKEEIRKGEAFQVVLSQRFEVALNVDALDVYRTLRLSNPSPYMYLFRFDDGLDIVGSSPEALIKIHGDELMIHPIAGTRPRSADPEIDSQNAEELLSDPKERAEHLMLVDLGRNDLGRVCLPGSVEVVEFMNIERYSHVMHIVSTVTGKLDTASTPAEALLAVFPAGTLSGAPKPRAMEIIEKYEPTRRGIYGGTIGYFDFKGNVDACIAIRTAVIKNGKAYVQAGAGIVADSIPANEEAECRNKAAAVLGAIDRAHGLKRI